MRLLQFFDPRNRLTTAMIWLVVTLALAFSVSAAVWVGAIARDSALRQDVRQAMLQTNELAADLDQALIARLGALRDTARTMQLDGPAQSRPTRLRAIFDNLRSNYPDLEWTALADADGRIVAGDATQRGAGRAVDAAWFQAGLRGPWIGNAVHPDDPVVHGTGLIRRFAELAAPLRAPDGTVVAVALAHLSWRWAVSYARRLERSRGAVQGDEILVLDRQGVVLVGPRDAAGRSWNGRPMESPDLSSAVAAANVDGPTDIEASVQRMPNGNVALVTRTVVDASTERLPLGWQVQLVEPRSEADARADSLRWQIVLVSLGLGTVAAVIGGLAAHRLTRRLDRLARAVDAVESVGLDAAPCLLMSGRDEVSRLGAAFFQALRELRREREALRSLTIELEERVARRTEQVERLAVEARDATFARERLKLARDLHDTLAHSMMAMLAEIRILRKLQVHDPQALVDELARAEVIAQSGLNEVRDAIRQLRFCAAREVGLGRALNGTGWRLANRTGLVADVAVDPSLAGMADDRAESLYRIAEEGLRNIVRHADASRVTIELVADADGAIGLRIGDDGRGFDATATPTGHYGLVGMRELAKLLGAALVIRSEPGEGTLISVRVPAPEAEA